MKASSTDKRGATKARLRALRMKYHLGEFSRRHRSNVARKAPSRSAKVITPAGAKKPRRKSVPWRWRYHPNPDPQQPPVPWQV